MKRNRLAKALVLLLAAALSFNPMAFGPALATLVPTTEVIGGGADLSLDRERVNAFLARDDVRRELVNLGVDPGEAARRVAAMTDEEIAKIARRLDELPAGEGAVGAIVGAAVLIFVILLITDILCLTHVFNFTRCAQR